jgi:hypothetical protein
LRVPVGILTRSFFTRNVDDVTAVVVVVVVFVVFAVPATMQALKAAAEASTLFGVLPRGYGRVMDGRAFDGLVLEGALSPFSSLRSQIGRHQTEKSRKS